MLDNIMDIQRETADNIGEQDTNKQLILKRNVEKIFVESGPLVIQKRTIGDASILGHDDNGKLGTMELGVGTMSAWSVQRVVNPNNIWREHFRNTQFKDTTNTTATWDTTNFRIDFTGGEIAQTLDIFKNSESITKVKVIATESSTSNIDYYISTNGGDSWFQVANNTETNLINNQTRVKIDTRFNPAGKLNNNIVAAGAVSGSTFERYDNKDLLALGNPYIIGGTVYDTDASTGLANVYLRVKNETTNRFGCTSLATGSTGRWLFDCRGLGLWANGDYLTFTIIGGSGTDDKELRLKMVSHGTSRITNLKVQYWT